jgi:HSP20 family molecular chaperone IbpA
VLELSQSRARRGFAPSGVFAIEQCHGTPVGIDLLSARLVPVEATCRGRSSSVSSANSWRNDHACPRTQRVRKRRASVAATQELRQPKTSCARSERTPRHCADPDLGPMFADGSNVPKARLLPDIVHPFAPLPREFEVRWPSFAWQPSADVLLSAERATVRLDLAGVSREHVHVVVYGKALHVTGHRSLPPPAGGADLGFDRAEILHGAFERHIELPWFVDPDPVAIDYDSGLLRVELRRKAADLAPQASDAGQRGAK